MFPCFLLNRYLWIFLLYTFIFHLYSLAIIVKSYYRKLFYITFSGSTYSKAPQEISLDESNKGHQLLKKMGWSGAGLGANEQGIEAPISGGEIRDKNDQYKGVGINLNDPYETFRKNKGQAFITRMKARAEERAEERGERDWTPLTKQKFQMLRYFEQISSMRH